MTNFACQEGPSGRNHPEDSHEIEIKFTAAQAVLDEARRSAADSASKASVHRLVSVYFDTPADDLRRSGHTLRIRRKDDGNPAMSVKSAALTASGPFHRREIEVAVSGNEPDLGLLPAGVRKALIAAAGHEPLVKRFDVQVQRTIVTLVHRASVIEMAQDAGTIRAGNRSAPVSELELELKSGEVSDLLDFATGLAGQAGLKLDFISKSERGFRLALGLQPSPFKAPPVVIPRRASAGEAMAVITASALAHFVANWDALRNGSDPEAIHQLRVALRRLRSALRLFRPAVPDDESEKALEHVRSEAKRIATAFGPARDHDVFVDMAAKGPLRSADCPGGGEALLEAVRERQAAAYASARQVVDSGETMRFVFDVQRLIARLPDCAKVSAKPFAAKALSGLDERARKRGEGLPDLGDDARHDLRISLKNLRYGAEFFAVLFQRPRKAHEFINAVSELQDLLGAHNDVVNARHVLDEMSTVSDRQISAAAGFALGWFARGVPLADAELKMAWRNFKRAPRFWA